MSGRIRQLNRRQAATIPNYPSVDQRQIIFEKVFKTALETAANVGGGNVVTHATFVWKSDTEFHSESQSTSPSFSSAAVEDSKWVGACPAGVESGDQGSYIGGVFKKNSNIRDLLKVKGAPR